MDRDIMLLWINRLLEQASDKQIRYLLYFIMGFLGK